MCAQDELKRRLLAIAPAVDVAAVLACRGHAVSRSLQRLNLKVGSWNSRTAPPRWRAVAEREEGRETD